MDVEAFAGVECEDNSLAPARDVVNRSSQQLFPKIHPGGRDNIRTIKLHAGDRLMEQGRSQRVHDGLDFGKLRHGWWVLF